MMTTHTRVDVDSEPARGQTSRPQEDGRPHPPYHLCIKCASIGGRESRAACDALQERMTAATERILAKWDRAASIGDELT